MNVVEKVPGLADLQIESKNALTSFLPFRKGGKEFEYGVVGGSVLCSLVGKRPKMGFSLESFKTTCLDRLKDRLSEAHVVDDLQRMSLGGFEAPNESERSRMQRHVMLQSVTVFFA